MANTLNDIWGITCYFNPQRERTCKSNYDTFRESSKNQGLPLITVELANGDNPFELTQKNADILIQVRAESVLWQKERLLNIALHRLPETCTKVVLLDRDILFLDNAWVGKTSQLLDKHDALQPFSTVVRLKKGQTAIIKPERQYRFGKKEGEKATSCCAAYFSHENRFLETGFAWAVKKSLLEGIGFYDKLVLGGADSLMAVAFLPEDAFPHSRRSKYGDGFPDELKKGMHLWQASIRARLKNSASVLPGTILHLFHGERKNRFYRERNSILRLCAFDPDVDVRLNEDGCWEWNSNKKILHLLARCYFWVRNGDTMQPNAALRCC